MFVGLCYNLKQTASNQFNNPNLPEDYFAECDTPQTVNAVREALAERHDVLLIEADDHAFESFRHQRPQIVFNIAEGLFGISREAQIPAMLEYLQIPYTGSDPLTLSICLDKSRTKEILAHHRIPTASFGVTSHAGDELPKIDFPVIVKPLHEGSSKGIKNSSIARNTTELNKVIEETVTQYQQPVIIEKFLPGREFTVALLGNGGAVEVLPVVEIKFDSLPKHVNPIYSYEAKWIWDTIERPLEIFECPAPISPELKNKIETVCRSAYQILRCRDWCRIDVRLDENGEPNILELNPLPGILPDPRDNSCFPKAARTAGMNYPQLINRVLDEALRRYNILD
jgi:D-alanine-D-alanine ligase